MADFREQLQKALADRYRLERELGRGGMAKVYLAHDVKHDRPVALKVMHPELTATLGHERFLREIRTTARLQHPHILPVHDSGEAAGQLWYTMPFVDGESLRDRLRREGPLPSLTLRAGFVQVSQARSDWAPDPKHPLPHFSPPRRVPHGVTLIGRLFDEGTLGRVGVALERAFDVAAERPSGF